MHEAAARPQLLVCHDMMGGYLDDKHPAGADNPEFYSMWHWDCVDIFVYFSHHMVTIPPVGWIAAAHKHGTKVGYSTRRATACKNTMAAVASLIT
jgi:mannosyl-glycoprotein endo-beta-N-acetylglucosaminidase